MDFCQREIDGEEFVVKPGDRGIRLHKMVCSHYKAASIIT